MAELWEVGHLAILALFDRNILCSRKTCGVLGQRRVLLVLLEDGNSAAREAAVSLLQDQGSYLTHLNIIR